MEKLLADFTLWGGVKWFEVQWIRLELQILDFEV